MSSKRIIALLFLSCVIAALVISTLSVRESFQYSFEAPKLLVEKEQAEDENAGGTNKRKKETNPFKELARKYDELYETHKEGIIAHYIEALSEKIELSDGKEKNATTALIAIYNDDSSVEKRILSSGRYFYPEELKDKNKVAVIDEALAVELFRISDPIGRFLYINKTEFEVIGVVKRGRMPSDIREHHIYLPFLSLNEAQVQPKILSANITLKKGFGGAIGAKKIFEEWQKDGTLVSLAKEKTRTLMPLRLLVCFVLAMLAIVIYKGYRKLLSRRIELEKVRLNSQYAQRLLPRWFGFGFIYVVMLLLWIGMLYLIVTKLLEPVYLFPEWVPSVIVEPKALIETFYNNRAFENKLIEIRTEQLIYLRFLRDMLSISCALFAMLVIKPYHRIEALVK